MDVVPALQQLGFGEYEARAYVALVQRGPLNGYELAKASGVPRANVYAVLERLSTRRAVLRLDEPGATRYAAVAPSELLKRLSAEYQAVAEEAGRSLEALAADLDEEPVWNVRGRQALLDQAKDVIRVARRSLEVALWPAEAASLQEEFADALSREVAITTLCMAACERECGGCAGRIYRYHIGGDDGTRALLAVVDDAEVVAGEVRSAQETLGVKTRQRLIVEVGRAYIRQSIALATVVEDLGARLDDLISPRARESLEALGHAGGSGFLSEVRRFLAGNPEP